MPKIRTTMRPDLEIDVPDADYLDLQRQGLLADTSEPPTSAPEPGPAPKKTAAAPQASGTTKEG